MEFSILDHNRNEFFLRETAYKHTYIDTKGHLWQKDIDYCGMDENMDVHPNFSFFGEIFISENIYNKLDENLQKSNHQAFDFDISLSGNLQYSGAHLPDMMSGFLNTHFPIKTATDVFGVTHKVERWESRNVPLYGYGVLTKDGQYIDINLDIELTASNNGY